MRIPPFIMSKEAGRNRVTLWAPAAHFPVPKAAGRGSLFRMVVVRAVGVGNRTVWKACRARGGYPEGPRFGGKGGIRDADHGKSYDIG